MERKLQGPVQLEGFEKRFLPYPGCVLKGVRVMGPAKDLQHPLITATLVTVKGHYSSFITQDKTVRVRAEGMKVMIPATGVPHIDTGDPNKKSKTVIEVFEADGAALEIAREDPKDDLLRFDIHHLKLTPWNLHETMKYELTMRNPLPPGEVKSEGRFGPWHTGDAGATPVKGDYKFSKADLGVFSGIDGHVSAKGSFDGPLRKIETNGTLECPNFEVRSSQHAVSLEGKYSAEVDGMHGDVFVHDSAFSWGGTTLLAHGDITGRPKQDGKTATIEMTVRRGRIQDLMRLVTASNPPAMQGPVQFRSKAVLPPGPRKFLERVMFTADFGIDDARFTKAAAQANIDRLSARAQGEKVDPEEDPGRVLSDLKGHVQLNGGVAHFSRASFRVPGAVAGLAGTYNLLNKQINMYGRVRMSATVSQATSGVKSVFLKLLDPLFKKKSAHAGADLPMTITGTYAQPHFGVSLFGGHHHAAP